MNSREDVHGENATPQGSPLVGRRRSTKRLSKAKKERATTNDRQFLSGRGSVKQCRPAQHISTVSTYTTASGRTALRSKHGLYVPTVSATVSSHSARSNSDDLRNSVGLPPGLESTRARRGVKSRGRNANSYPGNRTRSPMWPAWFRQWFWFRPGLRPGRCGFRGTGTGTEVPPPPPRPSAVGGRRFGGASGACVGSKQSDISSDVSSRGLTD